MSLQQYNVYDGLTACRVVATANQAGTYFNGPLNNGVGATLTYATGALTIDSVAIVQGDSVALVAQTNGWENGIYICTQTGATGVSAVLQRRNDFQCLEQIKVGQWCTIGAGTVSQGSMFVVVEPLPQQLGVPAVANNLSLSAAIPAGSGTASTKAASDNTKAIVASVGSAVVIGSIAHFVDVSGTIDDTAATVTNLGPIVSGAAGTLGSFTAFPPVAGNGFLELLPINAGGAFNTIISNSAMGQTSTISIPDPGVATSRFLLTDSATSQAIATGNLSLTVGALTLGSNGNASSLTLFPAAVGNGTMILSPLNAGGAFNTTIRNSVMGQSTVYSIPDIGAATGDFVVSTSPQRMKAVVGAAAAGGAATQNFVDAFCTAGSLVIGNWVSQTNPAEVIKVVPGVGSFDVISTADAGAGTFSYIILK